MNRFTEPRSPGLLQTVNRFMDMSPVAVLEQPSPRGVGWYVLG
jgi:hypothetical protein